MSKDQWIIKHEGLQADYQNSEIDLEAFVIGMKELGFDQPEIDTEAQELTSD